MWDVLDGFYVLLSHGVLSDLHVLLFHGVLDRVGVFHGAHSSFHDGMPGVDDMLCSVTEQYKIIMYITAKKYEPNINI